MCRYEKDRLLSELFAAMLYAMLYADCSEHLSLCELIFVRRPLPGLACWARHSLPGRKESYGARESQPRGLAGLSFSDDSEKLLARNFSQSRLVTDTEAPRIIYKIEFALNPV